MYRMMSGGRLSHFMGTWACGGGIEYRNDNLQAYGEGPYEEVSAEMHCSCLWGLMGFSKLEVPY